MPALDTIMKIHNKFIIDIYWLVNGVEQSQYFDLSKRICESDTELMLQLEILEFIKLKIK
jgi:hypothetical protein